MSNYKIGTANLVPGTAAPINELDKGVNQTYTGLIQVQGQTLRAYVKPLGPKQLANELVAASLCKALDLPTPDPYLVKIPAMSLPEMDIDSDIFAFGTVDAVHPSLKRRSNLNGQESLLKLIAAWPELPNAIFFDEWVANIDRNSGNILIGGPSEILLIDHGYCFTGPEWSVADLSPDAIVVNMLAQCFFPTVDDLSRERLKKAAAQFAEESKTLDIEALMLGSLSGHFLDAEDQEAVTLFLSKRIELLHSLVGQRLGLPELAFGHG